VLSSNLCNRITEPNEQRNVQTSIGEENLLFTARHYITRGLKARRIFFFFPFQLLVLHVKKNHMLIFFWLLLFAMIFGVFADKMGVPQQLLFPEYMGENNIFSFGIVGFALGGFITGFNLYTYITHGYRFPLIATLNRPFHKFSLNNFIIPALFILCYIWKSAHFQVYKELVPPLDVFLNIVGFLTGVILFQSFSFFYFRYTNKDAEALASDATKNPVSHVADTTMHNTSQWGGSGKSIPKWHVETYMANIRRIALARDSKHYSRDVLEQVFAQNHINASRFELMLIISFLAAGTLRESVYFIVPAAASFMLFFTVVIMVVSAIHSWIKGWTLSILIAVIFLLNYFHHDLPFIGTDSRAYGMDYNGPAVDYLPQETAPTAETIRADYDSTILILEQWKLKQQELYGADFKPKLVIINCSGGGTRSAYWSMRSLLYADSCTNGHLLSQSGMMTGASGGMLGAAYIREIMLRKAQGEAVSLYDTIYAENMSKDLLNPVILSMVTNDWFIRFQTLRDGDNVYSKDRAFAFENQLNLHTDGWLNRRLRDYKKPEEQAIIPMMILTPTIVNDGRRLLISPQPMSYLTQANLDQGNGDFIPEDIEFSKLFADQGADNLFFTTALRMNATFPYIFPMTSLPSEPPMNIMDAGIRDNFGLKTTTRFLHTFSEWINANTSGVVIVQVRDLPKNKDLGDDEPGAFSQLTAPLGSIYGNMTKTHDYNNEQMLSYLDGSFDETIQLITFELQQTREDHVSLSWHLTEAEKSYIRKATRSAYFQSELKRLQKLLVSEELIGERDN